MDKITPHLWFDKEAKEAADFYVSVFPSSTIESTAVIHDTPSGSCDIVTIRLMGRSFQLISAGPLFKFNPSISFTVTCKKPDQVDALWEKLIEGGSALMPLDGYPFSERYGWLADKYGLSWQLILKPEAPRSISPALMFVGEQCGKAEQAVDLYTSLFPDSKIDYAMRYEQGEEPDLAGTVKHTGFSLAGQHFSAMDSAHAHQFGFNEAVSLMVQCKDQEEIDRYWEALSADPSAEQCGWLKDRFGVSWQIVPEAMQTIMSHADPEAMARVTQAFLSMKKFDLATLEKAYRED